MTHPLPFHLVNVFTSTPHAGSQAAVVVLPPGDARANDEAYKTALAGDFNLPATVFLVPVDETVPKYEMRWYTGAGVSPE
jgi:predicted PhzF superfamily epimerase YddE/YHI9